MKKVLKSIMKYLFKIIRVLLICLLVFWIGHWVLLSIFGSTPVCFWCLSSHVIHDYYAATGISRDTLGALPAEIVEMYGEPYYIYEEDKGEGWVCERYYYEKFAIIFDSRKPEIKNAEDCGGVGFVLYSPDIKIRHDVHVGSTREQIIHAYRKCPTMTEQYAEVNDEELGDSVFDVGYKNASRNYLQFVYDENDIVTSIEYYPGSRYE